MYQATAVLKLDFQSDASDIGLKTLAGQSPKGKSGVLSPEIALLKSRLVHQDLLKSSDFKINYIQLGKILNDEKYKYSPFVVEYEPEQKSVLYNRTFLIKPLDKENFDIHLLDNEGEIVSSQKRKFNEAIVFGQFVFSVKNKGQQPSLIGNEYYFKINSDAQVLSYIAKHLKVNVINVDANTLKISFDEHNKEKALDIIEGLIVSYKEKSIQKRIKSRQKTIDFINKQLENITDSLQQLEYRLEEFVKSTGMTDPKPEFGRILMKKEALLTEKIQLKQNMLLLNDFLNSVLNNNLDTTFLPSIGELKYSSQVEQLNEKKRAFIQLKDRETSKTSAYKNTLKELTLLQQNLKQNILQEINFLKVKSDSINKSITKLEHEFNTLPSKESIHRKLKRLYNLHETFYNMFLNKKVEFSIANAGIIEEFDILQPPSVSPLPIYPVKSKVYATAFGAWFMMSLLLVGIRFMLQNTIINHEDFNLPNYIPFLGSIPNYTKNKTNFSKLVIHKNPKASISEAFRSIRTNIEFLNQEKKKAISITSTTSGEGKTFVATNLAGILALSDKKVCVLDIDMRKPKVHIAFDKDNSKGVSSILIGKSTIADCVQKTDIENLDFIAAGPTPPNPSELIMRRNFDDMLKQLKETYDVVILDSPPVGLVTDGVLLMKKVEVPIYVTRAEYTKKGVENNIEKLYHMNGITNVSVILNGVTKTGSSSYYGYGNYQYGYGYYDDENATSKAGILGKIFKK